MNSVACSAVSGSATANMSSIACFWSICSGEQEAGVDEQSYGMLR